MNKQHIATLSIAGILASLVAPGMSAAKAPVAPPPPNGMMQMMKAHQNAFKLVGLLGGVRYIETSKNPLNAKQAKSILAVVTAAQAKKQLDEATASKAIKSIQATLTDKQRKELTAMSSRRGPSMPPSMKMPGGGMMMGPGGKTAGPGRRVGPNGGPMMPPPGMMKPGGGMKMPPGGMMMPSDGKGGRKMGPGGKMGMPNMANFNPLKPFPGAPAGRNMSPFDDLIKALKLKAKSK